LPRYKTTRDIKGFAFVEFEKESEVEAALKVITKVILWLITVGPDSPPPPPHVSSGAIF
jgi:hypothetical protein